MTINSPARPRPRLLLIALAYLGFVSLGLPDAVIGVAWPTVRDTFSLSQSAIGMIFVASGIGYCFSSILAGKLTEDLGIGLLLAGSTGLVATALFGFACSPWWFLFVAFAVFHGLGSGAIDSGLNGYAAHYMSAQHMNWLHACYCLGAMLGPLLMTAVLTSGRSYSAGYLTVGTVMLLLSLMFLATRPQWGTASATAASTELRISAIRAIRNPTVLLQVILFFCYTGLEATFSQWTFTVLTESRGMTPGPAGISVGVFWASIGTGRIIFGLIADQVGIDRLLRFSILGVIVGALLFAAPWGAEAAFMGLILAGFGLAPVFPCLMTRTPQRLGGALSAHAVGFQMGAAMIGVAVIPGTLGLISTRYGLHAVPIGTIVLSVALWLLHEFLTRQPNQGGTPPSEQAAAAIH
ncbi:MAG: putative transporter [Planctomycetaceae bacterium]|nr:putative transporter [Planctomycetaceae bacterium]